MLEKKKGGGTPREKTDSWRGGEEGQGTPREKMTDGWHGRTPVSDMIGSTPDGLPWTGMMTNPAQYGL